MARRLPNESRERLRRAMRGLPVVHSFVVDPIAVSFGGVARLSWRTSEASRVEIEPSVGPVEAVGTRDIRIWRDMTYRLVARAERGVEAAQVSISVEPLALAEAVSLSPIGIELADPFRDDRVRRLLRRFMRRIQG